MPRFNSLFNKFLKKITVEKPIFLVGPGRCGTTVLYNVISNFEELCWFAANDNEKIFPKEFLEAEKAKLTLERKKGIITGDGELRVLFFGKDIVENAPAWKMVKDLSFLPIEGVHIWNKFFGGDFNATVTGQSIGIKEFIETICRERGKTRFINKNPENIKRMDALDEIFPDALFVCIIRNPFAVVNSMVHRARKEGNAYYDGIPTSGVDIDKINDIEYASLNLKQNLELVFEFSKKVKDRMHFLFYEDLIRDGKSEIRKLIKFLELSEPSGFFDGLPEFVDMNKKWKKGLTNNELGTISKILSETVNKLSLPYNLENHLNTTTANKQKK